jgi:hypothetical protein
MSKVSRRGLLKLIPAAAVVPFTGGSSTEAIARAEQAMCPHLFWTWDGDASDTKTEFTCRDCKRVVHHSQLRGWI